MANGLYRELLDNTNVTAWLLGTDQSLIGVRHCNLPPQSHGDETWENLSELTYTACGSICTCTHTGITVFRRVKFSQTTRFLQGEVHSVHRMSRASVATSSSDKEQCKEGIDSTFNSVSARNYCAMVRTLVRVLFGQSKWQTFRICGPLLQQNMLSFAISAAKSD